MLGRIEHEIRIGRIQKKDFFEKKQLGFFFVTTVFFKEERAKRTIFAMKGKTIFSTGMSQNICLRSGYRMGVHSFFRVNRHLIRRDSLRGKFLGIRKANW